MSYNTIFISELVLVAAIVCPAFSLIAYDCGGETVNKTTISLVETPDCARIGYAPRISDTNIVITQTSDQDDITVNRCLVKASHIVKRCGQFGGDDQVVGHYKAIVPIGRDACSALIETNTYIVPFASSTTLEFPGPGLHLKTFVSYGSPSTDGGCSSGGTLSADGQTWDRAVRYTSLEVVYVKETAMVDFEEKTVVFPNGIRCDLGREHCEHGDYGSLFWRVPTPKCENDVGNQAILYRGSGKMIETTDGLNVTYIQVNHGGHDFQIKLESRITFVCNFRSHYTEHPRLFVTFINNYSAPFPNIKSVSSRDISMMSYINSKIVYSLRHTKYQVDKLYKLFERERCLTQNRITSNLMSLAIISPENFAYAYFNEPGYTAVLRGEVIHVAKCQPVNVTPRPLGDSGVCYNELVVEYKNRTYYMTPRSRILVTNGRVVRCSAEIGPMYLLNGRWITQLMSHIVPSSKPKVIDVEQINYEFEPLENIANGGLYTSEMIAEYQKILTSPMEEAILSSRVVSVVSDGFDLPEGVDFSKGISSSGIKSLVERATDTVFSVFTPFYFLVNPAVVCAMFFMTFKLLIAVIDYIVHFMHLREQQGWKKAVFFSFFNSLSHIKIHKKNNGHEGHELVVPASRLQDFLDE